MAVGLGNGFGWVLALFLVLFAGVTGAVTVRAWRQGAHAQAGDSGGLLLEIVWVNMPLVIVIALVCCWLFFQPEPGFAAGAERRSAGDHVGGFPGSGADSAANQSVDHSAGRHGTSTYGPKSSSRP